MGSGRLRSTTAGRRRALAVLVTVCGSLVVHTTGIAAAVVVPVAVTAPDGLTAGEAGAVVVLVNNASAATKNIRVTLAEPTVTDPPATIAPVKQTLQIPRATAAEPRFSVTAPTERPLTLRACTAPAAKPKRRTCITHEVPVLGPSSDQLITRAERAGALTSEEALLYRVYASFGLPEWLPEDYRGDDHPEVPGHGIWGEVLERYDGLSEETKDALAPFFIPPFHAGSWWEAANSGKESAAAELAATVEDGSEPGCTGDLKLQDWGFVDAQSANVKVWYQVRYKKDDEALAQQIADEIDSVIWPKLTDLLGEPDHDAGSSLPCRGGDDRIDIALKEGGIPETYEHNPFACPTSTYILFPRGLATPFPTVAHELAHSIVHSIPLKDGRCPRDDDMNFLNEGTAKWVEHFVYPTVQTEQRKNCQAARFLLDEPQRSFEDDTAYPSLKAYGAYLLPFYAASTSSPQTVRIMWDNARSADPLDAVDQALGGGFATAWRKFVRLNWNRAPVNDYEKWDGMTAGAKPDGPGVPFPLQLKGKERREIDLDTEMKHLSARYKVFTVADDKIKRIDIVNQMNPPATLDAIVTYAEGDPDVVELQFGHTWCTEDREIKEIVLIFGNASKTDDLNDTDSKLVIYDECFRCPGAGRRTSKGVVIHC